MHFSVKIFWLVLISALAFSFASCRKKTSNLPPEPKIEYKEFGVSSETKAIIHFRFQDGDGDIGLKPEDTTGSFAKNSYYYYNFYMRFKFKNAAGQFIDSVWYDPITSQKDSGLFVYRIPYIENNSRDKSLTGDVYIDLAGFRPDPSKKIFKYEFFIFDRSKNKSNVVETPVFYYP